jgi:hypothetical protein
MIYGEGVAETVRALLLLAVALGGDLVGLALAAG